MSDKVITWVAALSIMGCILWALPKVFSWASQLFGGSENYIWVIAIIFVMAAINHVNSLVNRVISRINRLDLPEKRR